MAEPVIFNPERVVVPKPVADTRSAVVEAEFETSKRLVSPTAPHTVRRAYGVDVPAPT